MIIRLKTIYLHNITLLSQTRETKYHSLGYGIF